MSENGDTDDRSARNDWILLPKLSAGGLFWIGAGVLLLASLAFLVLRIVYALLIQGISPSSGEWRQIYVGAASLFFKGMLVLIVWLPFRYHILKQRQKK